MIRDPNIIELSFKEREGLLERIKQSNMDARDTELLTGLVEFNLWLQYSLEEKNISINKLQKMFGHTTEKRNKKKGSEASDPEKKKNEDETSSNQRDASENQANDTHEGANPDTESTTEQTTNIRKYGHNHGRLGHKEYTNAEIIELKSPYKLGDPCPNEDCDGTLKMADPGYVVKIIGQSFAKANKYVLETLRCNLCEKYFSAALPDHVCDDKYDPVFKAELCVHKHFLGLPSYRLEAYQQMIGIPLPDSTQFDKIEEVANVAYPAFLYLEKLAANAHLMHGDDTMNRIQSVLQENKGLDKKARKGVFTTGIIAFNGGRRIHLFYTSRKHCGENTLTLLKKRDPALPKIQYMCDALSSNMPSSLKATLINCLVHGRRNFIDIEKFYPEECGVVIDAISAIYKHEGEVREKNLNHAERLAYHKENSGPIMEDLRKGLEQQLKEHRVEPNNSLGKAYHYMLKHWERLTQFLRIEGAPLDNNTVERALKIPIRIRRACYFYATEHGAYIGSLLQSLICTCLAAEQNPVHYLTALQEHKTAVRLQPDAWMPWNYKETLAASSSQHPVLAQAA